MNKLAKWLLLLSIPLLNAQLRASEPKPVSSAKPPLVAAGWMSSEHANPARRLPSLGRSGTAATSPKAAGFTFAAGAKKEDKEGAETSVKPTILTAAATPTYTATSRAHESTSPHVLSPAELHWHESSVSQSTSALTARPKVLAAHHSMTIASRASAEIASGHASKASPAFMALILEAQMSKTATSASGQASVLKLNSGSVLSAAAPAPLLRSTHNLVGAGHRRTRSSIKMGYSLIEAVKNKNTPLLKQLISSGYLPNSTDDNRNTALNVACQVGNREAALFLLGCAGINVNLPNDQGETPLISLTHYSGDQEIFDALMAIPKIDITKRDLHERTALDYAGEYASHFVDPLNKLHAKAQPSSRASIARAAHYEQHSDTEGLLSKPTGCCG